VIEAWQKQIAQFRPRLKVCAFTGQGRRLDPTADITLTTYGVLRLDTQILTAIEWDTAVLDEAQTIKNPDSQVAQAAHQLRSQFRVALSGTPVENRLDDLWSQFEFLNPGLLGTRQEFQAQWVGPITRGDVVTAERLRERVKPMILRRLKRDVAPELPPKTELTLHAELSAPERQLYDALLASSRSEVIEALEQGESVAGALELLLRLRQAACHPALVPGQAATQSSKVELLFDHLQAALSQGHRALVFSQWTGFLDLIEPHLKGLGIPFLRLDGTTEDRGEVVERFQSEEGPPVLLLSLKAGGVGITLTRADHVYLMDSWWNPAVEEQATDRAYRIGQKNQVFVYRLIAKNTVEEKILELQKSKLALSESIVRDSVGSSGLNRDDLLSLLGTQ
jgi:SNF2 family DNA or RNA helicase